MDVGRDDQARVITHATPRGWVVLVFTMALAVPGTVLGLSVTDLVSTVTNGALAPAADCIETALLLVSVVVLFKMLVGRRGTPVCLGTLNGSHAQRLLLNIFPSGPRGFIGVVLFLGAASLVTPVFKAYASASCFHSETIFSTVIDCCMNVLKAQVVVLQMLLIVTGRIGGSGTTFWDLVGTAVIVSANICLCVECMAKVAKQSIINSQYTAPREAYSHAFCHNQTKTVTDAYKVIDKYFYSFIFHFCIYSVELLYVVVSANDRREDTEGPGNANASRGMPRSDLDVSENSPLIQIPKGPHPENSIFNRLKTIFCVNLCKYSYIPTFTICVIVFVIHILPSLKALDSLAWAIAVYMNTISGATFLGFVLIRKDSFSQHHLLPKHLTLALSGYAFLVLMTVENTYGIYNIASPTGVSVGDIVLFVSWSVFHLLGLLFQVMFLLRASSISPISRNTNKYLYLTGILWFLAISNFEMFCENTLLPQRVMKHVQSVSSQRQRVTIAYNAVKLFVYPGASLFRLQSFLLCLENLRKLKTNSVS